mgnify:CR=1 FL=1
MDLRRDVPGSEILDKDTLQSDASFLQAARQDHQHHGDNCDTDHQGVCKPGQVITDIEDESRRDHHPCQDGKEKGQAVESTLKPQGSELIAMVFLHDHRPEERGDQRHGQQPAYAIRPPMGKELPDKGQKEGQHHEDHGNGENTVNQHIDGHGHDQALPLACLFRSSVMGCS